MDLKKLMTGANPQSIMLEQTRGLKAKWEKTGLLENAGTETSKHGMAVLLENQAKQLLDESTKTGASAGSEEWAGVALPLVRRIFGSIAAKEFVSVQPMNLPSGLIFYMDFKYSNAQAGNPVRAFELVQSGSITANAYLPQYTKVSGADIVFIGAGNAGGVAAGVATLSYHTQPQAANRGDFEDRTAYGNGYNADLGIPEIELELKSEPIVAKTRKLKAVWTPELAQDLNAYHSIDAEAELTQMLSEYISLEIDLEILEMLQANAFTTDYWSSRVGYDYNTATGAFAIDSNAAAASAYTKSTWYQTLGIKLQKVSNKIHQLTMRGGANFIVCSPNVATILESMNGFSANPGKDALQFAAGVTNIGSISNRYRF